MSSLNPRIGQSLARYFKPIAQTSPRRTPYFPPITEEETSGQLAPEVTLPSEAQIAAEVAATAEKAEPLESLLPERTPSHWVELVLNLLTACRKISVRFRKRSGHGAYKLAQSENARVKVKSIGAILDLSSDDFDEKEPRKAA